VQSRRQPECDRVMAQACSRAIIRAGAYEARRGTASARCAARFMPTQRTQRLRCASMFMRQCAKEACAALPRRFHATLAASMSAVSHGGATVLSLPPRVCLSRVARYGAMKRTLYAMPVDMRDAYVISRVRLSASEPPQHRASMVPPARSSSGSARRERAATRDEMRGAVRGTPMRRCAPI